MEVGAIWQKPLILEASRRSCNPLEPLKAGTSNSWAWALLYELDFSSAPDLPFMRQGQACTERCQIYAKAWLVKAAGNRLSTAHFRFQLNFLFSVFVLATAAKSRRSIC